MRIMRYFVAAAVALITGLLHAEPVVTLHHVHGLAYSADGKRLFVPSHYGLAIYNSGQWSMASGPAHDYMGFAVSRDAFYSSGHPAAGSGLQNPFGLIRSTDEGKTWSQLGLSGESDFHVLAIGYRTNVVYVYNSQRNSRMTDAGIYSSGNNGMLWRKAAARGLEGQIVTLAPHPTKADIVAAATGRGLYLSLDRGESFRALVAGRTVTAVRFELEGNYLWVASHAGTPALERLDWNSMKRESIALPALESRDAIGYIAQNPVQPSEWAIASFGRDVYISRDRGKNWAAIAQRGAIK